MKINEIVAVIIGALLLKGIQEVFGNDMLLVTIGALLICNMIIQESKS